MQRLPSELVGLPRFLDSHFNTAVVRMMRQLENLRSFKPTSHPGAWPTVDFVDEHACLRGL